MVAELPVTAWVPPSKIVLLVPEAIGPAVVHITPYRDIPVGGRKELLLLLMVSDPLSTRGLIIRERAALRAVPAVFPETIRLFREHWHRGDMTGQHLLQCLPVGSG
ncbi:MAG: hypothetical protein MZV63_71810 [Marinilabiliales bacterium]|nr:hypothetical protein [Marinilabiliales bacterium]